MNTVVAALVLCLVAAPFLFRALSASQAANLPPGPRPRLLGAQSAVSSVPLWNRFHALRKQYGHVASVYQGKTVVVVLGTIKAATDLLEKRGSIYSSRPRNIMAGEILSGGMRGLGMPYGARWRSWRSLMHAGMSGEASQRFKPLQTVEAAVLMRDLLKEDLPMARYSHFRRFSVSIAFCISYGRRIASLQDPMVLAQQQVDECSTQGQYIVEAWPILLKLPRFLQWFRWEPEAQKASDEKLYLSLMENVREDMREGVAQPSIAQRGLEKQADFGLSDLETAYALSAPFSAGVTTVTSTLDVFVLAMLHYPDTMRKAQAEIDAVVGSSRMPDFDDADALPYVRALISEVMRWRPIAPLGVPHSVIADDTYETMHIPKGSMVVANLYTMSKDEELFPSPEVFDPERYLAAGPHSTFYFGFGRRICPGMHVAQNSLFIIVSRMLWAFDIAPMCDPAGKPVLPLVDDFIGGLVIRPSPFVYDLNARSEEKKELIMTAAKEAEVHAAAWQ
ncbi:hypothetical protein HYPSUDRAFT_169845 [Hypholoma sublateritium FD-334 SS-4]|uniref:Cytochrome P450 n=1 Tax=Hypholoma sublateritium (strain FD-334 SS-4) TaxID=945553 RepID=A0A0D2NG10_HYPSF|nr:hypothetical protein HYPSUDRAFT_169845 [Hypholoma sublateritium FD-334 SS-4]